MCKICESGTQCIANAKYGNQNALVRLDLEFNQIDCEVISDDGMGAWSENGLDISFCPVCGRELPKGSMQEESGNMSEIKKLITIKTLDGNEENEVLNSIHSQLAGNNDYVNCNIVVNDSSTRCDGTENEVRIYIFKGCENIPQITI